MAGELTKLDAADRDAEECLSGLGCTSMNEAMLIFGLGGWAVALVLILAWAWPLYRESVMPQPPAPWMPQRGLIEDIMDKMERGQ